MYIESTEIGTLLLIGIMALVTLATRWGGVLIMSYIPINYRVQQFIAAMSGSVLVAIVAPMAIEGDLGARAALLVTALGTLLLKRPLLSIAVGMALAGLIRL